MQFQRIGISAGNIKSDYLYYDKIIPIFLPDEFIGVWPERLNPKGTDIKSPFISDGIRIHPELYARLGKKRKDKLQSLIASNVDSVQIQKILAPAIQAMSRDVKEIKSYEPVPVLNEEVSYGATVEDFSSFSVISQNVIDIDVEDVAWEQLREFKIDKKAHRSLIQYRRFWETNYIGKKISFVEDDLYIKLDSLKYMANKHGLNTIDVVTKAVIKDSTAYSAALSVLAGIVLTGTTSGAEVLVPGAVLTVSGLTISIAKTLKDKEQFLRESDVLFLKQLTDEFGRP